MTQIKGDYKYTFTVFTPTYNRAYSLHRVYNSLKVQTYRDFEWLIVDDGSTDGTRTLVEGWQAEADFPIRYIWKENGGKHTATNRGVQEAHGCFFLTLDSDDGCIPAALERFAYHWESIPADQRERFSAVTGLVQSPEGNIVGDCFPQDVIDSNSLDMRYQHRISGEKWGFQRTDVMRQHPFPVVSGSHVPESIVWNAISLKYQTRYVNEALRIYYTGSGDQLSERTARITRSGAGIAYYYHALMHLNYPFPLQAQFKIYTAYVCYSLHAGDSIFRQGRRVKNKLIWLVSLPVGIVFFVRDRIRT